MYSDFTNCFSFTFLLPILIVTFTSVIFILWGRVNYQIQMYSPILAQGFFISLSLSPSFLMSFLFIFHYILSYPVLNGLCGSLRLGLTLDSSLPHSPVLFLTFTCHFYFVARNPRYSIEWSLLVPVFGLEPWIPYSLPTLTTFTCHIHFLLFYTYFFNSPDLNGLIFNLYFYLLFYFIYFI